MGQQGVHRLGDLRLGGDAHRVDGEAVVRRQVLIDADGVDGVGLAGGVDDADGVGVRLQGPDQLQLAGHRQGVGGAGDVAGVQMGAHRVGDGGEDHGDVLVLRGVEAGHGRVGGDAHHQVHVLGGEHLADLGGLVVVEVGVLIVHLKVGALHQAGLLQTLEEALPAVVQGAVLAVLADADQVLDGLAALAGGGVIAGGGVVRAAAAGGQGQDQGQGQAEGGQLLHQIHHSITNLSIN